MIRNWVGEFGEDGEEERVEGGFVGGSGSGREEGCVGGEKRREGGRGCIYQLGGVSELIR